MRTREDERFELIKAALAVTYSNTEDDDARRAIARADAVLKVLRGESREAEEMRRDARLEGRDDGLEEAARWAEKTYPDTHMGRDIRNRKGKGL